ncbi:hypothetical protein VNO77_30885 [Canavalia gladiata]|uniref:Uncharacterized protein n=1 Tax=Canavalia gladiata TaxID=3824 RepID=A0AAN9Q3S0_CANGL
MISCLQSSLNPALAKSYQDSDLLKFVPRSTTNLAKEWGAAPLLNQRKLWRKEDMAAQCGDLTSLRIPLRMTIHSADIHDERLLR